MSFDGFYISIHSLRMEGDISIKNMTANYPYFNPLPPYGGRHPRMRLRRMPETFQSTPSVWRETVLQVVGQSTGHHFNPLPPYGGRHQSAQYHLHYKLFQSTPSVWRETYNASEYDLMWGISIHSLRMEGDGAITTPGYVGDISIHSLRMEGDSRHCACGRSQLHFNPLPPHGGRPIGTTGRA